MKMGYILTAIIFYMFGHTAGWLSAHSTVATECEKLGKFYVGDRIFECTKIADKNDRDSN